MRAWSPATADDAGRVVALWATDAGLTSSPFDEKTVVRLIERDPEALIVADDADEIVATVICGWDGWRAHLYRVAVASGHRRQGLGRLLLEAAAERVRSLGARRLDAMVGEENTTGIAFWKAMGFERSVPEDGRWSRSL